MSSHLIKSSESAKTPIIVVKRRVVRQKSGQQLLRQAARLEDPSHTSEKPRSPVEFARASYVSGFRTRQLIPSLHVPAYRLREIFGEPTRIVKNTIEWVVRIPSKEVIRIVLTNRCAEIWGFVLTKTVESWVKRLAAA